MEALRAITAARGDPQGSGRPFAQNGAHCKAVNCEAFRVTSGGEALYSHGEKMSQPLPDYIKAGITGFGSAQRVSQPISTKDRKAFRTQCYAAARLADASVLDFDRSPFHGTGFTVLEAAFPRSSSFPMLRVRSWFLTS